MYTPKKSGGGPCSAPGKKTSYKGELKTLSIRIALEIRAAWIKVGQESKAEYVQLSLAAPEFGRRKLFANLGKAAGQDEADVFAIIWNPEE